jgi:penicillin-binding protein 1C
VQPFVAKAATNNPDKSIFWYIDDVFIGSTSVFHEHPILANSGKHLLTIVDTEGNSKTIEFYIGE